MPTAADTWLSAVLDRPAFVVTGTDEPGDTPGFAYAKVDVADVSRAEALLRRGFVVVDVNVTLVRDRDTEIPPAPGVEVVPVRDADAERLLDIAGSCFRYSRFHLDPSLSTESANAVKREWVRSYVEGSRGLELLEALVDGEPGGFLAVLDAHGTRVIDLVGVADEAQRRGVGSALVGAFVERHQGHELRVGTQIANIPSLRLYERCGFSIESAAYVLHRHQEAA